MCFCILSVERFAIEISARLSKGLSKNAMGAKSMHLDGRVQSHNVDCNVVQYITRVYKIVAGAGLASSIVKWPRYAPF